MQILRSNIFKRSQLVSAQITAKNDQDKSMSNEVVNSIYVQLFSPEALLPNYPRKPKIAKLDLKNGVDHRL